MNSGVYKILCKTTNKFYIGSSININKRFSDHRRHLKSNRHSNIKLQRTYNKYSENNFEFIIIEYVNVKNLLKREQFYIDTLKPQFNLALSARAPMLNKKHSKKTIEKLKGRIPWNKGILRTKKEKQLMSVNRKIAAQKMSKKQKQIWINNIKLNPSKYWLGKNLTIETKNKISNFWKTKGPKILCTTNNMLFDTQLQAAKYFKIKQGHISENLNNKRPQVKGLKFAYKQENNK